MYRAGLFQRPVAVWFDAGLPPYLSGLPLRIKLGVTLSVTLFGSRFGAQQGNSYLELNSEPDGSGFSTPIITDGWADTWISFKVADQFTAPYFGYLFVVKGGARSNARLMYTYQSTRETLPAYVTQDNGDGTFTLDASNWVHYNERHFKLLSVAAAPLTVTVNGCIGPNAQITVTGATPADVVAAVAAAWPATGAWGAFSVAAHGDVLEVTENFANADVGDTFDFNLGWGYWSHNTVTALIPGYGETQDYFHLYGGGIYGGIAFYLNGHNYRTPSGDYSSCNRYHYWQNETTAIIDGTNMGPAHVGMEVVPADWDIGANYRKCRCGGL